MARANLLIVDDEPAILSTLKTALSLEGYDVDVAGSVEIAEKKLAKQTFDLCIFDVMLPDGDGIALLQKTRAAGAECPILMMSGHATIDTAVRATREGATSFLEKPLNTDALLLTVEHTLRLVRAEAEARTLRVQTGLTTELVGESRAMRGLGELIARAAKSAASVLVSGERGTGKELVARAIHQFSKRARGPLEKLNCAALPHELIESELFGHEAGAFTGATRQRRGKFERASGGTLFLDEIGDMPAPMQAKLLRVLQEREIERVGGQSTISVDVRIVAATNRDLVALCESGDFRADLYDRINVIPLELPPLRARRDDIPLLARHFLSILAEANDRKGMTMSDAAVERLSAYSFPGNVRELRNLMERLVILTPDDVIDASDVDACLPSTSGPRTHSAYRPGTPFRVLVEEAERAILEGAITHHGGKMATTARALGLERSHLYKKAKALGLRDSTSDDDAAS